MVLLLVFLFIHPTVATTFNVPQCTVFCHDMSRRIELPGETKYRVTVLRTAVQLLR